jgi:Cytochrome C oxidase, cbb3-type, subunit III
LAKPGSAESDTHPMRDEPINAAQGRRALRRNRLCLAAALLTTLSVRLAGADDFAFGRRIFQDKAQCVFCHGWAGDGAGAPQSSGGAANLRETKLTREQLIEVISCGRPGAAMPRFDDQAYAEKRCYGGVTEPALGHDLPPLPPGSLLQRREIEALVDFLQAKIINRGPITRDECLEAFGDRAARSCAQYPEHP